MRPHSSDQYDDVHRAKDYGEYQERQPLLRVREPIMPRYFSYTDSTDASDEDIPLLVAHDENTLSRIKCSCKMPTMKIDWKTIYRPEPTDEDVESVRRLRESIHRFIARSAPYLEKDPTLVSRVTAAEEFLEQLYENPYPCRPLFTWLISIVQILTFAAEIIYNGGFESPKLNPMIGPSAGTLKHMGAKYGPLMRSPNYDYFRFITPIFLHAGLLHIGFNLLFQLRIGADLEREYGALRAGAIYFISGIGGNLLSCLFVPDQLQVGASSALYGIIGCLLVDLLHQWNIVRFVGSNPWIELAKMGAQILVSLLLGLFPAVDNFAHLGGFIYGILCGFALLPSVVESGRSLKALRRSIALGTVVLLTLILGFYGFFQGADFEEWCDFCYNLNCLEAVFDCSSF